MICLKSSALILILVLAFGLAHAQQNSATENAQTDALREKAFALLESLASQISSLQSAENRARLGSNIAESLWSHDEKRARMLLSSVEDDINAGLRNPEDDDRVDAQRRMVFLQLRLNTIDRIAGHDADLALAFLKATEGHSDKPRPYNETEMERALELRLAKEIANDNPDISLKLGRQSLARGFSNDLYSLLIRLNRKHSEQASLLFSDIVAKLKDTNLLSDINAFYFALRLAHSSSLPAADEANFRDLSNLLITSALANGCENKTEEQNQRTWFCAQIGSLLARMARFDPTRAAALKQWAPESPAAEWLSDANEELNEVEQNGNVDEILALASKYPQYSFSIYSLAIAKAEQAGEIERARKIAADYSGEPENRQRLMAQIDQTQGSISPERLAELETRLNAMPRFQDRLGLLLYLTSRIGDRKVALRLLDQTSGMVDTMKPGWEQIDAQMSLAILYCLQKSDRGLTIMESLVPKLNELVAAAVKLDGFDNHYLRDGEWNMSSEGGVGSLLTRLAQSAGYFAWFDFDRALNLAGQFERPELRMMAQTKLAQGILAGPPKRLQVGMPPPLR